jgi:hypothetical protein
VKISGPKVVSCERNDRNIFIFHLKESSPKVLNIPGDAPDCHAIWKKCLLSSITMNQEPTRSSL